MADMLVKLYELPESDHSDGKDNGVTIRRAIGPEVYTVIRWIERHFGTGWASEASVALHRQPITCLIAVKDRQLAGFACYDATALGFFGPTGVAEESRGLGIGKQLLIASLQAMRTAGYGYAIIGGVGPADFYTKVVGAMPIPDSTPGIYQGMLQITNDAQHEVKEVN